MRKTTKMLAGVAAAAATGIMLTGCTAEADTVENNMTTAADNFEVLRRIVFVNGITDKYLMTIEGFCSITDEGNQLEVLCKVGDGLYTKDMLGLSDNTFYFAEQMDPEGIDPYHHRVMFRPETIVPDIDLQTSGG
jgi:hypothetical protein